MKKQILPFVMAAMLLIPATLSSQTVLYSENFDTYTLGSYIAVSNGTWWTPWDGVAGGASDVKVSDEVSNSAPHSLKFHALSAQGDGDMVLKLANKTTGRYLVEFKFFITDGAAYGGYFNFLQVAPPPSASAKWAFSLTFVPEGKMVFGWNNITDTMGTYAKGSWIDVGVAVDLDLDSALLLINNFPAKTWQWSIQESGGTGTKQLGGVNFYTYAGGGANSNVGYYVDDVKYTEIPTIGVAKPLPVEMARMYPNPATDVVNIDMPGARELELYDMNGALVGRFHVVAGKADVTSLAKGVYVAKVTNAATVMTARIVKQ